MRKVFFLVLLFLAQAVYAQELDFFRVYNDRGKKLAKGNIYSFSDTSLTLTHKNKFFETPVSQIDIIKSKRTTGHRIGRTTLIVTGFVFIVVATLVLNNDSGRQSLSLGSGKKRKPNPDPPAHITPGFLPDEIPKPKKDYTVNGSEEKWKETKKALYYYLL